MTSTPTWIILSFDIGIKNLAYCMMEWISDKKECKILDWNVVNIIPDLVPQTCQGILTKKKTVCGKTASYTKVNNDNVEYYCATHIKTYIKQKDKTVNKIKTRKVDSISNQELNTLLVKSLDQHQNLLDCDEVVLEHQPSKNPKMKNLSFMLYSYFIIRGFIDKPSTRCKQINFRQINSVKKLSLYDGPHVQCKLKDKYSRNKFYSKAYCEYMIKKSNNDPKWLVYYNSCKKKDDLADCYLQGAWYLHKRFNKSALKNTIKEKIPTKVKLNNNKQEVIENDQKINDNVDISKKSILDLVRNIKNIE